ncbi:MAG: hypothetical protein CK424_02950 [Legionella sp.]|nr:MAG: hypothetical protein CK424_02950 [Legionella sp.]
MEELYQIQIFYRKYLSKYVFARLLKPFVVRIWNCAVCTKCFIFSQYIRARFFCTRLIINHRKLISRVYSYGMKKLLSYDRFTQIISKKVRLSYFPLVSFSDYCQFNHLKVVLLAPTEKLLLQMPTVYPENCRDKIFSNPWPMDLPSVYAFKIDNAEIIGKSDLIFSNGQCLHHGLYQFERDLPAEEMHGMISINTRNRTVFRNVNNHTPRLIEKGINLLGCATSNYVHWLTETAPKLALINQYSGFLEFSLIIDEDLHPNIIESVNYLNEKKRKLITIKRGEMCLVKTLISVSPVAYIPFEFRAGLTPNELNIDPNFAMYIPSGIRLLRENLTKQLPKCRGRRKKLYLKRTSSTRILENSLEVEDVLRKEGFEFVEPDKMSLIDQIKLFRRARIIVSQGGAALGNIIFAPEGCCIVAISAWSPYTIYYYFSNLASILKQNFNLIICEPSNDPRDHHQAHKGMIVDIVTLKRVLANEQKNKF